MQAYSNPARESDPHALPDIEVWYHGACAFCEGERPDVCNGKGWYYWFCFPGCLPDSDPVGPFATEAEALEDAQSQATEEE